MKKKLVYMLLCLMVVAITISGCNGDEKPESVSIGIMRDLTGPYAAISAVNFKATMAVINETNEAGGIDGVAIDAEWVDTQNKSEITLSSYKRWADNIIYVSPYTSTDVLTIKALIEEDEIPAQGVAASFDLMYPASWFYSSSYNSTCHMAGMIKWYYDNIYDQSQGPMKIACLAWDNAYGRSGMEPFIGYAESQGWEIVSEIYVSSSASDLITEMSVIKEKDPDIVATAISGATTGIICRDAAIVGLPTDVPIQLEQSAVSPSLIELAGDGAGYILTSHSYRLDDPAVVQLVSDLTEKWSGEPNTDFHSFSAYAETQIMIEAIRRAAAEVGWENLDGKAVKEYGLDTIADFDTGVNTASYTDYEGDRVAFESVRIWRVDPETKEPYVASDWFMMLKPADIAEFVN